MVWGGEPDECVVGWVSVEEVVWCGVLGGVRVTVDENVLRASVTVRVRVVLAALNPQAK